MSIVQLDMKRVEKPWGRHHLWPGFADPEPDNPAVGEVWYDGQNAPQSDLLVKYLFTSEKLSIQVHPDDAAARARGHVCGKDEAWLILKAEPDAVIGVGLKRSVSEAELRQSAIDGTIEQLVDWKPVKAGDYIYSPAGTIHAIGPGITMVEIQQNIDLTYRLYDYGRPRELHLSDAIAVADREPFSAVSQPQKLHDGLTILNDGPKFVVERWFDHKAMINASPDNPVHVVALDGYVLLGEVRAYMGSCWIADQPFECEAKGDILIAARQNFKDQ